MQAAVESSSEISLLEHRWAIFGTAVADGFHDLDDLGEVLGFAQALLLVFGDRLLEELGEPAVEEGILVHLLGDGLLRPVGDGVGFGARGFDLFDLFFEGFAFEDVHRFYHLDDFAGGDVGVEHLLDLLLVVAVIDFLGVADFDGGAQFLEEQRILFVALDGGFRSGGQPWDAGQAHAEHAAESRKTGVEIVADVLIGQEEFVGFLVFLVGDAAEEIPDGVMQAGELFQLGGDVGEGAVEVGRVELAFQGAVEFEGFVELGDDAVVVDDVAEVFAGVEAVHTGDGLEQGVFFQAASDVQDDVAGGVEAGEQFVHYDHDLGGFTFLKAVDDLAVVFFLVAVLFHHALPEAEDGFIGGGGVVAFAVVGGGDDHFRGDFAELVQQAFESDGFLFTGSGQLAFETGALPLLGEVLRYIPGDEVEAAVEPVEFVFGGELAFEVCFLLIGHAGAERLEHGVHRLGVHILEDVTAFVEERDDSLIGHGIADGVGRLDEAAEAPGGVLLLLHERSSGEANEAGVGERLLHTDVGLAVLAAMAFIHEHEDIAVQVAEEAGAGGRRSELVEDGGDDADTVVSEKFLEMATGLGLYGIFAALMEGLPNLVVQVDTIGDEDDAGILDVRIESEGLAEHDHGQGFAGALGVPDDAAFAAAQGVALLHTFQCFADGEVLLVAGDLFDGTAFIVEDELTGQLNEAFGAAEGPEQTVLGSRLPFGQGEFFKVVAGVGKDTLEEPFVLAGVRQGVHSGADFRFYIRHLLPLGPKTLGGVRGGVTGLVFVQGEDELGIEIEMGDFVCLLVTELLFDGGFERVFLIGALAFDDDEGDAVDEADDVRATGIQTAGAFHFKLSGDVENVIGRVLPIDVAKGEAAGFLTDGLVEAFAEGEQVVDLFAGADQTFKGNIAEGGDGFGDVLFVESLLLAFELNLVQTAELGGEDALEQDVPTLRAAFSVGIFRADPAVAQFLEELDSRNLADMGFLKGRSVHPFGFQSP